MDSYSSPLIFIDADGTCKLLPSDIERHVVARPERPLYECHTAVCHFDAGDASWMYAASGVKVRRFFCTDHRPVRVARYEDPVIIDGPSGELPFCLALFRIIFCSACRVKNADMLHWFPDIAHEKAAELPEDGIQTVRLMSVGEVQISFAEAVF